MTGNTIHIYPPGSSSGGDCPDPDPEVFLVSMAANPFFTGRETLLADIHRTLGERGRAAVFGLGGWARPKRRGPMWNATGLTIARCFGCGLLP
jgi:hypothetical protein